MNNKNYYIYIMSNYTNTVLYTGVTNNLIRRVYEHHNGLCEGFTRRYRVVKLVYYEEAESALIAIEREKQIKAGSRQKKIDIIKEKNPQFKDLYDEIVQ